MFIHVILVEYKFKFSKQSQINVSFCDIIYLDLCMSLDFLVLFFITGNDLSCLLIYIIFNFFNLYIYIKKKLFNLYDFSVYKNILENQYIFDQAHSLKINGVWHGIHSMIHAFCFEVCSWSSSKRFFYGEEERGEARATLQTGESRKRMSYFSTNKMVVLTSKV